MKKIFLISLVTVVMGLFVGGCSASSTWQKTKDVSSKAWEQTKDAANELTD